MVHSNDSVSHSQMRRLVEEESIKVCNGIHNNFIGTPIDKWDFLAKKVVFQFCLYLKENFNGIFLIDSLDLVDNYE